jgi:hypothetical protein
MSALWLAAVKWWRFDNGAFERIYAPGVPTDIEGAASHIREKARALKANADMDPIDAEWLDAMTSAFMVALHATNPFDKYKLAIFAKAVGEQRFAAKVLGPMIDAAVGAGKTLVDMPPDFFDNFPSTTNQKM